MEVSLEFFNVLIFVVIVFFLSLLLLLVSFFLSVAHPYIEKSTMYECGFQPFSNTLMNFDIKYYLIALLFLIFDVEVMFLLPWIFSLNYLNFIAFFFILFFLVLLVLGFYYEWNKGGLEWD